MNWDDLIQNENEIILLPEGIYDFEVTKFEKGWFDGSAKVDPCPKAILEFTVTQSNGKGIIKETLLLSEKTEWRLCSFFRCLGFKQHRKQYKMEWDKVLGATGKFEVMINEYQGTDGQMHKNNKVKSFLDKDEEGSEALPW